MQSDNTTDKKAVKTSAGEHHMKNYFITKHPELWSKAMIELESQQLLLQLCANHWKANHLLAYLFHTNSKKQDGEQDDEDKQDEGNKDNSNENNNHKQDEDNKVGHKEHELRQSTQMQVAAAHVTNEAAVSGLTKCPHTSTASLTTPVQLNKKKKQPVDVVSGENDMGQQEPSIPLATRGFMTEAMEQDGGTTTDTSFISVDSSIVDLK
ncbi:hypothetical protein AX17_007102, partial [Amanita inopinata Kibby_2008]